MWAVEEAVWAVAGGLGLIIIRLGCKRAGNGALSGVLVTCDRERCSKA